MSEYIKREDAIQAIVGHLVPKQYDGNLVNAGFEVAHEIVDAVPTADVVKVRHGHWEGKTYKCSICGKWVDPLQGDADMNYCPNCGAKMDGKDQGDKEYEDSMLAAQKSEE